jgi:hypothetical protein
MHNRLVKMRLTVSPAPSSGCELIVPVAHQTARGSGHKGSQRLRTRRKGPWQQTSDSRGWGPYLGFAVVIIRWRSYTRT